MRLWQDLTIREQAQALGCTYQPEKGIIRRGGKAVVRGVPGVTPGGATYYTGLVTGWAQWCRDNPIPVYMAVERHNAGLAPIRWYPRPGDYLVYTHRAPRGGVYRTACSGATVRWDGVHTEVPLEDETPRQVGLVTGVYHGFVRPAMVQWVALVEHGELRPASPQERAQAIAEMTDIAGGLV